MNEQIPILITYFPEKEQTSWNFPEGAKQNLVITFLVKSMR